MNLPSHFTLCVSRGRRLCIADVTGGCAPDIACLKMNRFTISLSSVCKQNSTLLLLCGEIILLKAIVSIAVHSDTNGSFVLACFSVHCGFYNNELEIWNVGQFPHEWSVELWRGCFEVQENCLHKLCKCE